MSSGQERIGRRALNRALLDRQMLLGRSSCFPLEAVEHLVGMQAQAPNAPYVGLWTRLSDFDPMRLAQLIAERAAVRTHVMRATIHLLSAGDCLSIRPLLQPLLARRFASSAFARRLDGVDLDAVCAAGRQLLEVRPRSRVELGRALHERWPERDPESLAYAVTYLEATVQPPPRGLWGESGPAVWATTDAWLGSSAEPALDVEKLVLRYVGAFGPASVNDVQAWSGLTRLREVTERLRPQLRRFRDEDGNELLDLTDAPRPDPDTPAPPRFLPEYDNALLGHGDRSRIIPDRHPIPLQPGNGARSGTVLVDGFYRATWKLAGASGDAVLEIEHFTPLSGAESAAVSAEGARLLSFLAPGADTYDVRFVRHPR